MTKFSRFMNDESGATAIEYALIAAVVGVGIIAALGTLAGSISTTFNTIGTKMTTAAN